MKTYNANGFKGINIRPDGKSVSLEISTTEGEVAFAMPAAAITALLPIFVRAEAQAKEKAGLSNHATVFNVAGVSVRLPTSQEGIIISLKLPEGVEMGFQLDMESARRLVGTISKRLEQTGGHAQTVQ